MTWTLYVKAMAVSSSSWIVQKQLMKSSQVTIPGLVAWGACRNATAWQ